jgi:hypothetical protein
MGLIVLGSGFFLTLSYGNAAKGSKLHMIIYGFLFSGLVISPFAEMFFMNLNFLVKAYAVSWLIYEFPVKRNRSVHIRFGSNRLPPTAEQEVSC